MARSPGVSRDTSRYHCSWITPRDGRDPVLVADPQPAIANALCHWLSQWYRVLAPITDLSLLAPSVHCSAAAAVILDVPTLDEQGLDNIQALNRQRPATRLIAFSRFDTPFHRSLCRSLGATHFVPRTAPPRALLAAIDATFGRNQSYQASVSSAIDPAMGHFNFGHRHGPLIQWMLRSGFPHTMIATLAGVTRKTVEYHSRQLRGTMNCRALTLGRGSTNLG